MVDGKVGGTTTEEHSSSGRKSAESRRSSERFPFGGARCVHGKEAGSTRTEQGALPSCAIDSFFAVPSPRLWLAAAALLSRSRRATRCRIRRASRSDPSSRSPVSPMPCRCRVPRQTRSVSTPGTRSPSSTRPRSTRAPRGRSASSKPSPRRSRRAAPRTAAPGRARTRSIRTTTG